MVRRGAAGTPDLKPLPLLFRELLALTSRITGFRGREPTSTGEIIPIPTRRSDAMMSQTSTKTGVSCTDAAESGKLTGTLIPVRDFPSAVLPSSLFLIFSEGSQDAAATPEKVGGASGEPLFTGGAPRGESPTRVCSPERDKWKTSPGVLADAGMPLGDFAFVYTAAAAAAAFLRDGCE